jgi:hypothetical protein
MLKPGDTCPSCSEYWRASRKATKKLRKLPGTTQNKKLIVLACPYCDGEPIFEMKQEPPAHA